MFKAYAGFHSRNNSTLAPVATGNWGCGAFRGDARLKSLIQLMVCTVAGRDMVYFTFGDYELKNELHKIYMFLSEHQIKICKHLQVVFMYLYFS